MFSFIVVILKLVDQWLHKHCFYNFHKTFLTDLSIYIQRYGLKCPLFTHITLQTFDSKI